MNSDIKASDILQSILARKKILEKVKKLRSKKINKKSNVTLKVIDDVACKYHY